MSSIKKWLEVSTKKLVIAGLEVELKALTMKELGELSEVGERVGEMSKKTIKLSVVSPIMTDEEIDELPAKIGRELIGEINKLNGLTEEAQEELEKK